MDPYSSPPKKIVHTSIEVSIFSFDFCFPANNQQDKGSPRSQIGRQLLVETLRSSRVGLWV